MTTLISPASIAYPPCSARGGVMLATIGCAASMADMALAPMLISLLWLISRRRFATLFLPATPILELAIVVDANALADRIAIGAETLWTVECILLLHSNLAQMSVAPWVGSTRRNAGPAAGGRLPA
jgi:hypothetical protein